MDDYIRLTTWFVREVLDAYENWNGKDNVPMKNPRTHNGPPNRSLTPPQMMGGARTFNSSLDYH
jgi:hypothetical protein